MCIGDNKGSLADNVNYLALYAIYTIIYSVNDMEEIEMFPLDYVK